MSIVVCIVGFMTVQCQCNIQTSANIVNTFNDIPKTLRRHGIIKLNLIFVSA